jgi:hypothetical protein
MGIMIGIGTRLDLNLCFVFALLLPLRALARRGLVNIPRCVTVCSCYCHLRPRDIEYEREGDREEGRKESIYPHLFNHFIHFYSSTKELSASCDLINSVVDFYALRLTSGKC